jgi:hypothetical protein
VTCFLIIFESKLTAMRTITLEIPDSSADLVSKLSKADKDKLSGFVQFWLNSFASEKKESALEIMQRMQRKVALQNLSKDQLQDLINESMT